MVDYYPIVLWKMDTEDKIKSLEETVNNLVNVVEELRNEIYSLKMLNQ